MIEQEGHSVLAHINGFLPYFYVPVPRGFVEDEDINGLKQCINASFLLYISTLLIIIHRMPSKRMLFLIWKLS